MSGIEQRELERFSYWQGQLLRSRDFRDQQANDAQLRAWHNRAVHNAYGIAKGVLDELEAHQSIDGSVLVKSGMAYDCFGRELLLREQQSVRFEENREQMFLVLRYMASSSCGEMNAGARDWFLERTSTRGGNAELVWLLVKDFSFRDGVPLARTQGGDHPSKLDETFIPRHARPLARPRIATGTTIPGATTWEVWDPWGPSIKNVPSGVQVRIDTSSAGFTKPPVYFASLQGSLFVPGNSTRNTTISFHLDHIDEVTIKGFVFRFSISVLQIASDGKVTLESEIRKFLQQQQGYVAWLAIEWDPCNQ